MEPTLLGHPITALFFYFIVYSFLGWVMETAYCSILEKKLVARGFLHGPICPIYGCGVLLMILFFTPLGGNLPLFYFVSAVVMTAWEYLVGWFLEATTRIKYWDYSNFKFNLHGRVCLRISLCWGLLSYVCIFWIHPAVSSVAALIPSWLRYCMTGAFAALLAVDATVTVRALARITILMHRLEAVAAQLQSALARGRTELDDSAERLRARYADLLAAAERQTRRLRSAYQMSSGIFADRLDEVRRTGAELAERVRETAAAWREERRRGK